MRLTIPILIACLLASSAGAAGKQARKKEIKALRQELRHLDLLVREDLRAAGPAPAAGAVTELADGSVYVQADSGLVFEKLGPVRVGKLLLRGGHRLVVRLRPPSNMQPRMARATGDGWSEPPPWERAAPSGPHRGRHLVTDVDLDEFADVREALSTLVFLPGESPSQAETDACIGRYPDHDEAVSKLRCGVKR